MEKVGLGRERKRERESLMDDYVHARTRVQHDDISAIFQEVETACRAREKSDGDRFSFFLFFSLSRMGKIRLTPLWRRNVDCFDELTRARFWIGYHSIPLWTLD